MKRKRLFTVVIALLGISLTGVAVFAAPNTFKQRGSDILHLFVRKSMSNEGVEGGASGRVNLRQNQQGNANIQRLEISVTGLAADTDYELMALVGDDTNYTSIEVFSTDVNGRAALRYRRNGNGNGNGLGNGKKMLPAALNPVSDIRGIAVFNTSTQAVLNANLTAPDKLQYLVKRDISSGNVGAWLRIKATTKQVQFRLVASGLNATNDYLLVLNEEVVESNAADAHGNLVIFRFLEDAPDILNLRSVAIWDGASNVVVSTELP